MKKFFTEYLSISNLIDLLICVVLGGALENFMQTEAHSDHECPEQVMIGTFIAIGSYIFVFLLIYPRKSWFEFVPNWVVLCILGSFMNSLINHGILAAYRGTADETGILSFLSRMGNRTNAVISSTIIYSLFILIILCGLKLTFLAILFIIKKFKKLIWDSDNI